jgi:hypothetical protein
LPHAATLEATNLALAECGAASEAVAVTQCGAAAASEAVGVAAAAAVVVASPSPFASFSMAYAVGIVGLSPDEFDRITEPKTQL